jgi:hypothetical protein
MTSYRESIKRIVGFRNIITYTMKHTFWLNSGLLSVYTGHHFSGFVLYSINVLDFQKPCCRHLMPAQGNSLFWHCRRLYIDLRLSLVLLALQSFVVEFRQEFRCPSQLTLFSSGEVFRSHLDMYTVDSEVLK